MNGMNILLHTYYSFNKEEEVSEMWIQYKEFQSLYLFQEHKYLDWVFSCCMLFLTNSFIMKQLFVSLEYVWIFKIKILDPISVVWSQVDNLSIAVSTDTWEKCIIGNYTHHLIANRAFSVGYHPLLCLTHKNASLLDFSNYPWNLVIKITTTNCELISYPCSDPQSKKFFK